MKRQLRFLFCLMFTFCMLPWIAVSCVVQVVQKTFWILLQIDQSAQETVLHFFYNPLANKVCIGCEQNHLVDVGPVIIDQTLLPKEVETNHENR